MKITLPSGKTFDAPFTSVGVIGYVAKEITLDSDDALAMFIMHQTDPERFLATLAQFTFRFVENRVGGKNAPKI